MSLNSKMTLTPWKKHSMTILLIGETGIGKTAFLDLLANVCAGRVMEEFRGEHDTKNEVGGDHAGSQTMKAKLYHITCANGCTINVMDTPGLSDPRGTDEEHKKAIAECIKDQIDAIDCVLVLVNGTAARLSIPTRYVLTVISGMFPNSIVDNMAFMFTRVSSPFQPSFKREALPVALRNAKFWVIDNPLACWLKFQKAEKSGELPEDADILEVMRADLEHTYDRSMETLNSFFKWVDERKVQPSKDTNELYRMSNKMEASISNVLARLSRAEAQKTELSKIQNEIDTQKQIKKIYEHYSSVIIKRFYTQEGTDVHNTLCCAPDCYRNCHEVCPLEFTLDQDRIGQNCEAFSKQLGPDGGYICNECGHSSKFHQHYRAKWVQKEVREVNEDQHAKQTYRQAQSEEERALVVKEHIQKKIKEAEASVAADMEELGSICAEYNELALSGNCAGYFSEATLFLSYEKKMRCEDATTEVLDRLAGHIDSLKQKKVIVDQALKEKKAKSGVAELGAK